jgi:hypothetical protein
MLHCLDEKHAINICHSKFAFSQPCVNANNMWDREQQCFLMPYLVYFSRQSAALYDTSASWRDDEAESDPTALSGKRRISSQCEKGHGSSHAVGQAFTRCNERSSSSSLNYLIPLGLQSQSGGQHTPDLQMLPQKSQEI